MPLWMWNSGGVRRAKQPGLGEARHLFLDNVGLWCLRQFEERSQGNALVGEGWEQRGDQRGQCNTGLADLCEHSFSFSWWFCQMPGGCPVRQAVSDAGVSLASLEENKKELELLFKVCVQNRIKSNILSVENLK